MAKDSAIEWTDHTFNPWWGCAKVSPACDGCYAERDAKRHAPGQILWGEGSTRRFFGADHWKQPYRWERALNRAPGGWPAAKEHRARVFCASMADVFDNHPDVEGERQKLWGLIESTPALDWLLLTKRISNARKMMPAAWLKNPRPNVWLGISVVTQAEADRDVPRLLATPARIRFLSCEPLLEPLDLARWLVPQCDKGSIPAPGGGGQACPYCVGENWTGRGCQPLNWVIVGGESGPGARPMHPHWPELIRRDCAATSTPFFFKQWGEWAPWDRDHPQPPGTDGCAVAFPWRDSQKVMRVGKKRAGRTLYGQTWSQFPESA